MRATLSLAAAAAFVGSCFTTPAALAHATLEQQQAEAGSFYKAVMRIGHGCEGAPTTAVRIRIPDGVRQAKPMPKPGWELKTVVEKLDQPYDWYGQTVTEDVREIVWSGGKLPDNFYDEFVFRAKLPDDGAEVLYFKTVQECETGVHRWIDIPEEGKSAEDYPEPAPSLTLTKGRSHSQ